MGYDDGPDSERELYKLYPGQNPRYSSEMKDDTDDLSTTNHLDMKDFLGYIRLQAHLNRFYFNLDDLEDEEQEDSLDFNLF